MDQKTSANERPGLIEFFKFIRDLGVIGLVGFLGDTIVHSCKCARISSSYKCIAGEVDISNVADDNEQINHSDVAKNDMRLKDKKEDQSDNNSK